MAALFSVLPVIFT